MTFLVLQYDMKSKNITTLAIYFEIFVNNKRSRHSENHARSIGIEQKPSSFPFQT